MLVSTWTCPHRKQSVKEDRDKMRKRNKKLTRTRMGDVTTGKGGYLEGRIGLIIDGLVRIMKDCKAPHNWKQLGYDVHMIFVNTSLTLRLRETQKRAHGNGCCN